MTTTTQEARVRRLATREGYRLYKCRRRDPHHPAFGGYMLIEPERNFAVLGGGGWGYDADLDEVEDWLRDDPD